MGVFDVELGRMVKWRVDNPGISSKRELRIGNLETLTGIVEEREDMGLAF